MAAVHRVGVFSDDPTTNNMKASQMAPSCKGRGEIIKYNLSLLCDD